MAASVWNEASRRTAILGEGIGTIQAADDAAGYGEAEAKGICRRRARSGRARSAVEFPQGALGRLVPSTLITARSVRGSAPDQFGVHDSAILQRDADVDGAVDYVIVGDDVAIGAR